MQTKKDLFMVERKTEEDRSYKVLVRENSSYGSYSKAQADTVILKQENIRMRMSLLQYYTI